MTALEVYFHETGQNASRLAVELECAVTSLTRPLRGERKPSVDLALKIETVTKGRVTASDFLSACAEARRAFLAEKATAA